MIFSNVRYFLKSCYPPGQQIIQKLLSTILFLVLLNQALYLRSSNLRLSFVFSLLLNLDKILDKILDDEPYFRKDWNKFNEVNFILEFLEIDWTVTFEASNLHPSKCIDAAFNNRTRGLMKRHIPTLKLTKYQVKTKLKPWITGIVNSMSKRDFYQHKYFRTKNEPCKAIYKRYRNFYSVTE